MPVRVVFTLLVTAAAAPAATFETAVAPVLGRCLTCHGPDKPKGGVSLHGLTADLGRDPDLWRAALDQMASGAMPPKSAQADPKAVAAAVAWLDAEFRRLGQPTVAERSVLPKAGNLLDHAALFGTPAADVTPGLPRVWRLRPDLYRAYFIGTSKTATQPFDNLPDPGLKDYAAAATVGDLTTEQLLRNAEAIVDRQILPPPPLPKGGKPPAANLLAPVETVRFPELGDRDKPPTLDQVRAAVIAEYKLATARAPTDAEVKRYLDFYEKNQKTGLHVEAARATLVVVLMKPGALFREELGGGAEVAPGKRMLAPHEIVTAVSFALGNRRDEALVAAAEKGGLKTRDEVAAHVKRMIGGRTDGDRILEFFRQYFGYGAAVEVFKDEADNPDHDAAVLVGDTEQLIRYILKQDRDVLRELLTTNKACVQYRGGNSRVTSTDAKKRPRQVHTSYGLPADWVWTAKQPVELPADRYSGILTQPSWLVAHSGNADNDVVRRGKWVRERLLGGTVPDLPITADAQVPDDPTRTLRDRLGKTTADACWRCHQKMNPLGLPFEQFDHFGRYRTTEVGKPVDASGSLDDCPVGSPVEMLRKLAASDRVRQVFVRHAFRYFLGRNEAPGDAKALQDADQAYVSGGGSFKALVISLLTSESFLCRAAPPPDPPK